MDSLALLLLQCIVILAVARLTGWLFRKLHQPTVIGEMAAGILLGPSLLGWIAPGLSAALFPPESLSYLYYLSQVGLILFMFLVGMEFDARLLRNSGKTALATSLASIIAPFLLGLLTAVWIFPTLGLPDVPFLHFGLFMGVAMSITAFPVLARILAERKLMRTRLGSVSIISAAINDVVGWLLLAVIVLLVRASSSALPVWAVFLGLVVYVLVMLFPIRLLMQRLIKTSERKGFISPDLIAVVFLVLLGSAWATEFLGVHALFGAFVAGVTLPKQHHFVEALTEKLESVSLVLLLPIFFAYNGLQVSIGLVNGWALWLITAMIILVAIGGKLGGAAIAARLTGIPWREAGAIGILMNTRGLMELVLLNIGLEIGVLSPTVFTMMVLMALITTIMTAPLLEWVFFSRVIPETYLPVDPEVDTAMQATAEALAPHSVMAKVQHPTAQE